MNAKEFAEKIGRPYTTVALWLRENRIPGAYLLTIGGSKFWQIPETAIGNFKEPTQGRPKGSPNKKKGQTKE